MHIKRLKWRKRRPFLPLLVVVVEGERESESEGGVSRGE